jgi:acetyltransferase-like isoleucine patch superfamily enzyme
MRRKVTLDVDATATLEIAEDAVLGDGTRVHAHGSAVVRIGAGAVLGERCVILSHEHVEVGSGARLGDGVVLVDFAHAHDDAERPVRHQPLRTAPVVIGAGAVVGPGAVVEPGGRVAPGATVLANTVVR